MSKFFIFCFSCSYFLLLAAHIMFILNCRYCFFMYKVHLLFLVLTWVLLILKGVYV